MNIINLFQVSFFSACVSCGLAVLRNTKYKLMPFIFTAAFCTAFTFNGLNGVVDTFIAGLFAGFVAAVVVGIFHRKGLHGYLFIVIPVIYCIGPGGAMYKIVLSLLDLQFETLLPQLTYIIKDAFGIRFGIIFGTKAMNIITKQESEKF